MIIDERERTHGPFQDTAAIAQALKAILRDGPGWAEMDPVFREALDQIACKAARIVVGHPYERDHWKDIAGYATLAERSIPRMDAPVAPSRPDWPWAV